MKPNKRKSPNVIVDDQHVNYSVNKRQQKYEDHFFYGNNKKLSNTEQED